MAKTTQTILLENALTAISRKRRWYGCAEVTIGFSADGHGDEIVDYMSMDAKATFRCYEIKISRSDLASDAKKSWYGHLNYLVVSEELFMSSPDWDNYIPSFVGILCGQDLRVIRKAVRRHIADETKEMLKSSLIRTLYWKMDEGRDAGNVQNLRQMKKQLEEKDQEIERIRQEQDMIVWTYHDYEYYYALNHQLSSFSLAADARKQRNDYNLRKQGNLTWIHQGDHHICPVCRKNAFMDQDHEVLSDYCPFCGEDLRKL